VKAKEEEKGREVGIVVELKTPTHFRALGLPLEEKTLELLKQFGYQLNGPGAASWGKLIFESFDMACIRRLSRMTTSPVVQLIDDAHLRILGDTKRRVYSYLATDEGLDELACFCHGVSADKSYFFSEGGSSDLVWRARSRGLRSFAYTLRDDAVSIHFASAEQEFQAFLDLRIDGVFTDFPDTGVSARAAWESASGMFALSLPSLSVKALLPGLAARDSSRKGHPSHWTGAIAAHLRGLPLALQLATAMLPFSSSSAGASNTASAAALPALVPYCRAPGVQVLASRRAAVTPSAGA